MSEYSDMFIEDYMLKWREEGKTWAEIDKLRKQKPFCLYPSRTHQESWKLFKEVFKKHN